METHFKTGLWNHVYVLVKKRPYEPLKRALKTKSGMNFFFFLDWCKLHFFLKENKFYGRTNCGAVTSRSALWRGIQEKADCSE